jgi:hypothetical protein
MDYFNIGASIDFIEHSWNHAQLFYTSILRNSTIKNVVMNYTHINSLDIVRFQVKGDQVVYKFRTTINNYRDQSDD